MRARDKFRPGWRKSFSNIMTLCILKSTRNNGPAALLSILFTLMSAFRWPVLRVGPAFLPFIEPELTEMRPVGWLSS